MLAQKSSIGIKKFKVVLAYRIYLTCRGLYWKQVHIRESLMNIFVHILV